MFILPLCTSVGVVARQPSYDKKKNENKSVTAQESSFYFFFVCLCFYSSALEMLVGTLGRG